MKVELIAATQNPMDVISLAAGCSSGKSNISHKRVDHCYVHDHMSVFEHASITLKIEGISRACTDQMVRHRMCSFVVESQRYVTITDDDWYVTPPAFEGMSLFNDSMADALSAYSDAIADGVAPEDARFLLPMATKTNVVMTVNIRQLFHMFYVRIDPAAQWEIRELFQHILSVVKSIDEQWYKLIKLYADTYEDYGWDEWS